MSQQLKEYHVQTECGRNLVWSDIDMESLLRSLIYRGYRAVRIQLLSEYEAEVKRQEASEEMAYEIKQEIERKWSA